MVLYLSDAEVRSLLPLDESAQVIEDLFRQEQRGEAENRPTTELTVPKGFFRLKAGATYGFKSYGFKAYGSGGYRVFVYDLETHALDGIVNARGLTEIRTGAVSAVGTRFMARPESRSIGIVGTGREARAQVSALCRVRPIRAINAYSRSAEKRDAFAREMTAKLEIEVVPVASGEDCVRDMDIVVTITNARDPVLAGAWLAKGTFICAVGATTPERRELDEDAVRRAGTIVVEHMPQAQAECGELRHAVERGDLRWSQVRELKDIVSGTVPGRTDAAEITLFDTIGVGTEDVALATCALRKARAQKLGQELPI